MMTTMQALRAIHRELEHKQWTSDTLDKIAEYIRQAGYVFESYDDDDKDDSP